MSGSPRAASWSGVVLVLLFSCSDDAPPEEAPGDGGVDAPPVEGGADAGCASDEVPTSDGSACSKPGVPPDGCGDGFVSDGVGGCVAVMPAEPCPEGTMAIPGETECHEVAPCGLGDWGDIPVEETTVYVNASYAGGASDGTKDNPWTTIAEAIVMAPPGGQIAIAAGTYEEGVLVQGKPVRLWGRCPALVEIVGGAATLGALDVRVGAGGTEIHRLALRGSWRGIAGSGSEGVLLDELWVHDAVRGIDVEDSLGPTRFSIKRTLVEKVREAGVLVLGADVSIEASVVRDTQPYGAYQVQGIGAQENIVNHHPAKLRVQRSVVERNVEFGVIVAGGSATIEDSLVRDTEPSASGLLGMGVAVQDAPVVPSDATLRRIVVARNHTAGVYVSGANVSLEGVVVEDTLPQPSDLTFGRGISMEPHVTTGATPEVAIVRSVVRRNVEGGIVGFGADVRLEETLVRDTLLRPADQRLGRGIGVQDHPTAGGSFLEVRSSGFVANHDVGVFVWGSSAVVDRSFIRETLALPDGRFGDGLLAAAGATITLTASHVAQNARAGLANFGSAVDLEGNVFTCNPIDLDGEAVRGEPTFVDHGDNVCGCDEVTSCQIVSARLEPPDPLGP